MVNESLLNFVRDQIRSGTTKDAITAMLMGQGWTSLDVDQAFAAITATMNVASVPKPPVTSPSPQISAVTNAVSDSKVSFEKPHRARRYIGIALIVIVGLLIAGGASAYYFLVLAPSPRTILYNALHSSLDHATTPFSFAINATSTISSDALSLYSPSQITGNVYFSGNGSIDIRSTTSPKFALHFSLDGNEVNSMSKGSVDFTADTVLVPPSMYIKIDNLGLSYTDTNNQTQKFVSDSLTAINKLIPSLENIWVQIDAPAPAQTTATTSALTKAEATLIRNYVFGMSYVSSIENLGVESIGGINAYHIQTVISDKGQLVDLMRTISLDHNPSLANTSAFNTQMDALSKSASRPVAIDIWIGKSDFRIYKLSVGDISVADAQSSFQATTSYEVSFSNYGNITPIVAPSGSIPLKQFLQSAMSGFVSATAVSTTTHSNSIPRSASYKTTVK